MHVKKNISKQWMLVIAARRNDCGNVPEQYAAIVIRLSHLIGFGVSPSNNINGSIIISVPIEETCTFMAAKVLSFSRISIRKKFLHTNIKYFRISCNVIHFITPGNIYIFFFTLAKPMALNRSKSKLKVDRLRKNFNQKVTL